MWLTCLLILLGILGFTWWTVGPHRALAVSVLLSLVVPSWLTQEMYGFPVSIPLIIGMSALGAYCIHPRAIFRARLVLVDWAILCLSVTHICVDWGHQGFSFSVPLRAYGEWYVPYVCGRLALRNADDVRALLPLMVGVIIWLAVISAVQGLTGVDLAETVFGVGQVDTNARMFSRWGIHRAFGHLRNPIYFGVLQLLLFPWSVYAAARAWNHRGPSWWLVLPLLTAVGVFFPMSRACQGGLVLSALLAWLLTRTRWQVTIPVLGVIVAAFALLQSELTINLLDAWGGGARQRTIEIGGKQVSTSVTLNRIHIVKLYGPAMRKSGLFGFGTEAVTGFPINIPMGQQDLQTLKAIWTVDNSFLLMGLRFGYLGLACLLVWCVGIAVTWWQITVGESITPGFKAFTGTMTAVSLAMLLVLLTVFMPEDFGFWYIWTAGTCAGLKEGLSQPHASHHSTHSSRRHSSRATVMRTA